MIHLINDCKPAFTDIGGFCETRDHEYLNIISFSSEMKFYEIFWNHSPHFSKRNKGNKTMNTYNLFYFFSDVVLTVLITVARG